MPSKNPTIGAAVDLHIVRHIDALVARFSREAAGEVRRSDIIRMLLSEGLRSYPLSDTEVAGIQAQTRAEAAGGRNGASSNVVSLVATQPSNGAQQPAEGSNGAVVLQRWSAEPEGEEREWSQLPDLNW